MRSVVRFVLSMVFLGLLVPLYALLLYMVGDRMALGPWDLDERGARMLANWVVGAVLVTGWLGCYGWVVVWTRWRVILSVFALALTIALAWLFLRGYSVFDEYVREETLTLTFVVWAAAWLVSTLVIWTATRAERLERFVRAGPKRIACPGCGYDLTGLHALTCPECGKQYSVEQIVAHVLHRGDLVEAALAEGRIFVVRWTKRGIAVGAVLLVAALVGSAVMQWRANAKLAEQQALWQRTIHEDAKAADALDVPADQNAALAWARTLEVGDFDHDLWSSRGSHLRQNPWDDDMTILAKDLTGWRERLDLARDAARMAQCDWRPVKPPDFNRNISTYFFREMILVMIAQATFDARQGRVDDAAAWLLDAVRASGHMGLLDDEDAFNAQLYMDASILKACEELFRSQAGPTRDIVDVLAARDYNALLLARMRINGNALIASAPQMRSEDSFWPLTIADTLDEAEAISCMAWNYKLLKSSFYKSLNRSPVFHTRRWEGSYGYLIKDIAMAPDLIRGARSYIALARQAHDLRALRQTTGAYPDADGFTPTIDPQTHRPFGYVRVDGGFAIWSDKGFGNASASFFANQSYGCRTWYWDCKALPKDFQAVLEE